MRSEFFALFFFSLSISSFILHFLIHLFGAVGDRRIMNCDSVSHRKHNWMQNTYTNTCDCVQNTFEARFRMTVILFKFANLDFVRVQIRASQICFFFLVLFTFNCKTPLLMTVGWWNISSICIDCVVFTTWHFKLKSFFSFTDLTVFRSFSSLLTLLIIFKFHKDGGIDRNDKIEILTIESYQNE